MERRKLLIHIDPEEEEGTSKSSTVSRLFIECPRVVYTAFCFIVFITTCLFLIFLFVFLLLLQDFSKNHKEKDKEVTHAGVFTTDASITTTIHRNKQSMFEYLKGLNRTFRNKNKKSIRSKNLTQVCWDLIRADEEFKFNNLTINNVFFTKHADEVIDEKYACCIESTLTLNPYKTVFILNMDANENLSNGNETQAMAKVQTHLNYLKSFYKNLRSRDVSTNRYFKGTPFDGRRNNQYLKSMTELITLWKYSGLVNSKQNLLLSKMFFNQSTILFGQSIFYSSYPAICSPIIEKLVLNFKTLSESSNDSADHLINTAIDNVTNNCGDCDFKKLNQFQVCTVMKPSCYFVNIDSVWNNSKVNLSNHCPKMYDSISSKATDRGGENENKPPLIVSL